MSSNIPQRRLGLSGPLVPSVGFGAMGLSAFYGQVPSDIERLQVLNRAWELGCRHWDTADFYADSEELIGKWFKANPEKRNDIFLATKFGATTDVDENGLYVMRGDPGYVRECCEESLRNLGVDCIDLFYYHRVDGKTPIEVTIRAMVDLKREGKIKYIGVCECSETDIRRAYAVHPISAIQAEYSPFSTEVETAETPFLSICRELNIALVAFSPLGRGIMTGKYSSPDQFEQDDFRSMGARYSKENYDHNMQIVRKFQVLSEKKGCTSGQLCLAWLLAQGDNIFLIPGTKRIEYLEENAGAAGVQLSEEEVAEIRKIVDGHHTVGERVPYAFSANLNTSTPLE